MNTRKFIIFCSFVIIIFTLVSCAKTVTTTPIQFQKQLLSGTGNFQNTQHVWQLDSTKINNVPFILNTTQKQYKKTFTYDGGYSDTDNNTGKWEITTLNKLKQTIIYAVTNKQDSTVYDIVSINSVQLSLSIKLTNGQTAVYSFKIYN